MNNIDMQIEEEMEMFQQVLDFIEFDSIEDTDDFYLEDFLKVDHRNISFSRIAMMF